MIVVVVFCYFNCGKCCDIQIEYICSVIRLKIQVSVSGCMRKVSFIFVVVGYIFVIVFMLLIIDVVC